MRAITRHEIVLVENCLNAEHLLSDLRSLPKELCTERIAALMATLAVRLERT